MLGIIFTGGQAPQKQIIKRIIENEKDALFIAADSGLITALNAEIKPDWIIGDMDSLGDTSVLSSFPSECVIRHEMNKDYSDTELAFSLAKEKSCDDVWIIGGGGGRIDHLFSIRSLFERDIFPRRWITDTADIQCIDAEEKEQGTEKREGKKFFCCLNKGDVVSVFPLGGGPWHAVSEGLKWPLDELNWDRGFYGLSNVAVEGEFSITALLGRFMVILPFNK